MRDLIKGTFWGCSAVVLVIVGALTGHPVTYILAGIFVCVMFVYVGLAFDWNDAPTEATEGDNR